MDVGANANTLATPAAPAVIRSRLLHCEELSQAADVYTLTVSLWLDATMTGAPAASQATFSNHRRGMHGYERLVQK
jgi:hypothetical protein